MNRFFKKLTGILLVLALAFSSVLATANNSLNNVKEDALNEAMEVLRLFSIIPDYYDYSVDETENVPRADFVAGVAKMIGLTSYDGTPYYYDVPENHYAFNEISALTQQGILNGVGNKLFRPDDVITKNEGYKIIMTVLGYGDWAEYNGGYPAGYASAANRARVSDGVSSNENITVSDMINIFYNAITASVLEPTSYGSKSASYTAEEGNTLLSLYRDIYYREGVMTGANNMSFEGASLENGEVIIDDVIYISDADVSEYLGENVKFFYHYNAKDDIRTIKWVKPLDRKNTMHLTIDNDASFEKETYTLNYLDGDKKKSVSLDRAVILVYNGNILKDGISEVLNMPEYEIKLVKGDNGLYNIAVVKAYENYVVGSIDKTEFIIYDKANGNRSLSLNENNYERMSISVLGMTATDFSGIAVNNVLSVYLSKDKKYIDVHISVDSASGVVDNVRNKEEGTIVLIDAVEYFIPKTVKNNEVKAGQSVKFYLDTKGEVAYIEGDTTAYTPAYLVDAVTSDNGLSKNLKFRVLTKQGKIAEMQCGDSVKIDGKIYKDIDKASAYLMPEGNFAPQFVMIRTNNEEKIVMIDTVVDNPDSTDDDILQISVPLQGSVTARNKSLGHKMVLDGNSLIFSLPTALEGAEDKEFAVMSGVTDWKSYSDVESYKVRDRIGFEQFIVVHGHNNSAYWESDVPVLVTGFGEAMNDDGEIIESLLGYQGNTEREFAMTEGISLREKGVEKGDVVRLKMNPDGSVDDYTMLYDYSAGEESVVIGGFASQLSFSIGFVTDIVDGVIKIGKTKGATDISIQTASVPCIFYDESSPKNEVYAGSIEGAKTYFNEKDDCSMVVLTQSYGSPRSFIIFK